MVILDNATEVQLRSKAINVIESPELRDIFVYLKPDLENDDIPHRINVRSKVLEIYDQEYKKMAADVRVCDALPTKSPHCNFCPRMHWGVFHSQAIAGQTPILFPTWLSLPTIVRMMTMET